MATKRVRRSERLRENAVREQHKTVDGLPIDVIVLILNQMDPAIEGLNFCMTAYRTDSLYAKFARGESTDDWDTLLKTIAANETRAGMLTGKVDKAVFRLPLAGMKAFYDAVNVNTRYRMLIEGIKKGIDLTQYHYLLSKMLLEGFRPEMQKALFWAIVGANTSPGVVKKYLFPTESMDAMRPAIAVENPLFRHDSVEDAAMAMELLEAQNRPLNPKHNAVYESVFESITGCMPTVTLTHPRIYRRMLGNQYGERAKIFAWNRLTPAERSHYLSAPSDWERDRWLFINMGGLILVPHELGNIARHGMLVVPNILRLLYGGRHINSYLEKGSDILLLFEATPVRQRCVGVIPPEKLMPTLKEFVRIVKGSSRRYPDLQEDVDVSYCAEMLLLGSAMHIKIGDKKPDDNGGPVDDAALVVLAAKVRAEANGHVRRIIPPAWVDKQTNANADVYYRELFRGLTPNEETAVAIVIVQREPTEEQLLGILAALTDQGRSQVSRNMFMLSRMSRYLAEKFFFRTDGRGLFNNTAGSALVFYDAFHGPHHDRYYAYDEDDIIWTCARACMRTELDELVTEMLGPLRFIVPLIATAGPRTQREIWGRIPLDRRPGIILSGPFGCYGGAFQTTEQAWWFATEMLGLQSSGFTREQLPWIRELGFAFILRFYKAEDREKQDLAMALANFEEVKFNPRWWWARRRPEDSTEAMLTWYVRSSELYKRKYSEERYPGLYKDGVLVEARAIGLLLIGDENPVQYSKIDGWNERQRIAFYS